MKILVAEDEPIMLKTIALRLRKDGYDVITVADGREAIEQIEEQNPDLIITDIMMPYSSGLEIVGKVKASGQRNVPVIVLSAMGQENVVVEAFNLGADDYITKPFSPNELSMRVKRLAKTA
ncbi:response regulator transcription factor [Lacibacter luteus]|uniref:Response regulator transcription factor n=1 Tax=Lacibacter luteus TaxID=2508719 RepID=A0A4Q1CNE4_9BACT|nr:response regulator [Lacibacter luteus]RXK62255.1 response regulator transcription factor [Lacibacter luteus]